MFIAALYKSLVVVAYYSQQNPTNIVAYAKRHGISYIRGLGWDAKNLVLFYDQYAFG